MTYFSLGAVTIQARLACKQKYVNVHSHAVSHETYLSSSIPSSPSMVPESPAPKVNIALISFVFKSRF